jgi:hypothetical protein
VKVVDLGSVSVNSSTQIGSFDIGDTITGATTGLTAKIYRSGVSSLFVNIDKILSTDTTFVVSDNTGLAANDFIHFNNEIVEITSISGYEVTVSRAEFGTTSLDHNPGAPFVATRESATATTINEGATFTSSDNVLTLTSATGIFVSDYIRIDDEILRITSISGNDVTVERGSLFTTAASHTDGTAVTVYTQVGTGYVQFFNLIEEIDNGSGATVDLQINPSQLAGAYSQSPKFVYAQGVGEYEFPPFISLDGDRTVRFNQSDASNTGYTLRFSLTSDGTNLAGTEYTTNVVVSGTAGNSGAYTEIDLDISDLSGANQLFIYTPSIAQISNNGYLLIDLTPNYTTVYLYDLDGALNVNDTFTINNVNYTITAVSSGAYGYVQDKTSDKVKVSLGNGSTSFAGTDTFYDSPRTVGADRTLATVSSVSAINDEDYIFYGKTINANTTDRNTGIVVGPGQSIMVNSAANTINYVVQGFEDSTTDFTPVYYYRQQQASA